MSGFTLMAATGDDPLRGFVDFFSSPWWRFLVDMAAVFAAALWLACAYWVYKDARRRLADRLLVVVAVLAGLVFGPFGLVVYAIVRPPETLAEREERELELQLLATRLDEERCAFCRTPVAEDYLVCPTCGRRLRVKCPACQRALAPEWRVCPYCETEVRSAAVFDGL